MNLEEKIKDVIFKFDEDEEATFKGVTNAILAICQEAIKDATAERNKMNIETKLNEKSFNTEDRYNDAILLADVYPTIREAVDEACKNLLISMQPKLKELKDFDKKTATLTDAIQFGMDKQ